LSNKTKALAFEKKRIPLSEAIIKIRTYCNYRERCHKEVREKLYDLGLWKRDVDLALMQMMDENLLNEERYARSYVRGHFYNKKWGKRKINYELKSKQIHDRLIQMAFEEIDEAEYAVMIKKLIAQKSKEVKGSSFEKQQKVSRYLAQKGYDFNDFGPTLRETFAKKGETMIHPPRNSDSRNHE
jgi:regulatory protein